MITGAQSVNREAILERIEKCRQILDANPESQIFAALAEAHRKLGDLKSALDTCNDGLRKHPHYGSAYLVLAKIARDQKRYFDAEKAAQKAIELEGRTRSAEILLSDIYLQTGNFRGAESILNRLAKADPGNTSVQRLLQLAQKAIRAAELPPSSSGRLATRPMSPSEAEPRQESTAEVPTRSISVKDVEPEREPEPPAASSPEPPPAPAETESPESLPVGSDGDGPWIDVFAALERFPHLRGRLAVGYDGLLLETDMEIRSDAENASAMAAELFKSVCGEWPDDRFGSPEQLMIETEQSIWWIWPFPEYLLVLWCDPHVNMGPLRLRLTQLEGLLLTSTNGGNR